MAQPQKFGLTGNDPEEASNVQKTKPKSKKQVQEGKAESYYNYADMTIYAIEPDRVVPQICHHFKLDLANIQQRLMLHSLFSG